MSSDQPIKHHNSSFDTRDVRQSLAFTVGDMLSQEIRRESEWSLSEDSKLMSLVSKFGEGNWLRIYRSMGSRAAEECEARWNLHLKQTVKKGSWTVAEDAILRKWISENGANDWTRCSELISGRNGKQCRERWVNILDPRVVTGDWSLEDQVQIFSLMKRFKTSWSRISSGLNGRTENSIKNYFYSTMRRIDSSSVKGYLQGVFLGTSNAITDTTDEEFIEAHQMSNLNELGRKICLYLQRELGSPTKECPELYNFLRGIIINKETSDKASEKTKRNLCSKDELSATRDSLEDQAKERKRTLGQEPSRKTKNQLKTRPNVLDIISEYEPRDRKMLKKRAPSFSAGADPMLIIPYPIRRKFSGIFKGVSVVQIPSLAEDDKDLFSGEGWLQKGSAFKPTHQMEHVLD